MTKTTIYLLSEPDSGRVRYVGKTTVRPAKRYSMHVHRTEGRNHRVAWIRKLKRSGLLPTMTVVQEVYGTVEDGGMAERRWIEMLRADGLDLVNSTDGGDGGNGHANLGKKRSAEARARLSAALRGRKLTAEHRAKVGAGLRGKKRGPIKPHVLAALVKASTGRVPTPEHRQKLIDGSREAWAPGGKMRRWYEQKYGKVA